MRWRRGAPRRRQRRPVARWGGKTSAKAPRQRLSRSKRTAAFLSALASSSRPRPEARLENIAELALALKFDAAAELPQVRRGEHHAGIDGRF